jgi:hypothetical protein
MHASHGERIMRPEILISSLLALQPLAARADAPTDFSGEWMASEKAASDSSKSTSSPSQPSGGRSGMGGHGGGHGGGMSGMGGGGGASSGRHGRQSSDNSAGSAATANVPADPRLHAHALIIRQSDVVFDIEADGQRLAYRFDNRNNYGAQYGGTVTLTWEPPELVVETHPDDGGSIEEDYSLSDDGKQLALRILVQRAGEDTPHETRRTFVRNDNDPASGQPTLPP